MTETTIGEQTKRIPRGLNKSYYHYLVYDGDKDESKYYFTLKEIGKTYDLCRATLTSMILCPDKPCRKYPNVKIYKDKKHKFCVDYNMDYEDLKGIIKY